MNNQLQIDELKAQIQKLQSDLNDLSTNFYKNNFTSHQDFNKSCNFSTSLKVPSYSTLPNGEVGNILEYGGKLMICTNATSPSTWTVVGTQT